MLGVAVRHIAVWCGETSRVTGANDPRLRAGFHDVERDAEAHRWTNGDALLPPDLLDGAEGPVEIVVRLAGRTLYPLLAGEARQAA